MNSKIFISALIALSIVGWVVAYQNRHQASFGNSQTGGAAADACANMVTQTVVVGKDIASLMIASSSNRAFARIGIDKNATNTLELAFNNGASSTPTTAGVALNATTTNNATVTASPGPAFIDFGLNTSFPYTGAVSAFSTLGSTTALVTQCSY